MNEEPGLLEVQENNTMITFGRKLKHLRQKNHLTQKELGMAVGFPESCADVRISQYESDVRTPKEDLMKLFASKLGVRLNSLPYRYSQNPGSMRQRSIGGMS